MPTPKRLRGNMNTLGLPHLRYDYIGAGMLARKNYPVPQQRLDYWGDL